MPPPQKNYGHLGFSGKDAAEDYGMNIVLCRTTTHLRIGNSNNEQTIRGCGGGGDRKGAA